MKSKIIKNPKALLVSFLIVIAVSVFGSFFTDTTGWYQSVKPDITPPGYIFPIVWTILYFLIALSIYFSWINAKNKERESLKLWFSTNLLANALWSLIFFKLHLSLLAFIDILIILISSQILIKLT